MRDQVNTALSKQALQTRIQTLLGGKQGLAGQIAFDEQVDIPAPPRIVQARSEHQHTGIPAETGFNRSSYNVLLPFTQPHRQLPPDELTFNLSRDSNPCAVSHRNRRPRFNGGTVPAPLPWLPPAPRR